MFCKVPLSFSLSFSSSGSSSTVLLANRLSFTVRNEGERKQIVEKDRTAVGKDSRGEKEKVR